MRKVKIVCTMGPACSCPDTLRDIAEHGLDVARFNFSHGDHASHGEMLDKVRALESEIGRPIACMLDTKGPEIRTGKLAGGAPVELCAGARFTLSTDEFDGDASRVSISFAELPDEISVGGDVFIDDGAIHLRVLSKTDSDIECEVIIGGMLGEHKGINVPGTDLSVPTLTEKDIQDIKWGVDHEMDIIAVSFVRRSSDIAEVRGIAKSFTGGIKSPLIMAKIETVQAVECIESIVDEADAVMIARGDLGVEMPTQDVPMVQKRIINICREKGKPVIVATQMLDSMMRNPRPTRAEASDVANAVLDGADAVMLSGETAGGKYPALAVRTMERIIESTECQAPAAAPEALLNSSGTHLGVSGNAACGMTTVGGCMFSGTADSVSRSAMRVANETGAAAIVPLTVSGRTASMISRYRPSSPIVAVTTRVSTWRALALMWGVRPMLGEMKSTTEESVDEAIAMMLDSGSVKIGDTIVITAGFPAYTVGSTNILIVWKAGKSVSDVKGTRTPVR